VRYRLLLILALAAIGCGEKFPLAPVAGTVTLDGNPLAGARIGFEPVRGGDSPEAGPGSYATTDANGRFELTALTGKKGAVVGKHRVWVRTMRAREGEGGRLVVSMQERLPKRYNEETELEFVVPASGTNQANFDLTSR
jgi:hypothetical protein